MFYNVNTEPKSGDVFQVLKYRQRKHANRASFHIQRANVGIDEISIENVVNFLKACILPRDESKLKQKLEETTKLRSLLLSQNDPGYPKIFDFYLVDPKMV